MLHPSIAELLAKAAALCVKHDVDLDAFMRGAHAAYLDSRPGLREQLEELQLRARLEVLRARGHVASA